MIGGIVAEGEGNIMSRKDVLSVPKREDVVFSRPMRVSRDLSWPRRRSPNFVKKAILVYWIARRSSGQRPEESNWIIVLIGCALPGSKGKVRHDERRASLAAATDRTGSGRPSRW